MFESIWNDVSNTFKKENVVPQLILINVLAYIVLNRSGFSLTHLLCRIAGWNAGAVVDFFSLPDSFYGLALQPWSLLTYGFLHDGFFHILFNMIFLYIMGNLVQEFLGSRKLLTVFIAGIIISGLFEVMALTGLEWWYGYHSFGYTVGASGGVMAVLAAAATLLPDFEMQVLLWPVRLKYIFLCYFVIDVLSLASASNWGGHVAHIGGALFGYMYIKDIYSKARVDGLVDKIVSVFTPKPKLKVTYRSATGKPNTSQAKRSYKPTQQEIDAILDKISQSGYDSLTRHEKDVLFAVSNEEKS